jgi:small subunit ribosomal protein S2
MTDILTKKEIAKQYVKASVHYGHPPKEWNPKMAPYILCEKYGYHIFDLVKTSKLLRFAGNVLEKKAEKGANFLFVGTNKLSSSIIAKQAKRANSFYINYRWLGGTLTNWSTVQKQIERLKELEQQELEGIFENLSKKEYSSKRKEIDKLRRLFNGIKEMKTLPDLVIFTNQLKDTLAIQECLRLGIPSICIVDTNCDPDLIPYPIPGNDDSSSSINFILNSLVNRILAGYNIRNKTQVSDEK